MNYIITASRKQVDSYQSVKDEFDSTYDHWEGDYFAILSDGISVKIEKLKSHPHGSRHWSTSNSNRVKSILRDLVKFKRSPDEIVRELLIELRNLAVQLPWELVEDKELVPKDKDLQKFLRKANELAKKTDGLIAIRNRAKADIYLRVLAGIVGCFVKSEGKTFQLIKSYECSIAEKIEEIN
ncbi:hypothetical protein [Okeania sp. SIO2B3]|uniref:hypothetical protein n=1 Tax=Okeania sp. SIO2B3 TaxID=2607784 RepID=UPI0013C0B380|nr:hypothetical protein [Okeania sp. SIO2B3]NET40567.1 hypothetical protein [Okeania sp. SIO2B3]